MTMLLKYRALCLVRNRCLACHSLGSRADLSLAQGRSLRKGCAGFSGWGGQRISRNRWPNLGLSSLCLSSSLLGPSGCWLREGG